MTLGTDILSICSGISHWKKREHAISEDNKAFAALIIYYVIIQTKEYVQANCSFIPLVLARDDQNNIAIGGKT